MTPSDLLELRDDLLREEQRLQKLVQGLEAMEPRLSDGSDVVEAAALRLHSFYTGVERSLLLVSRVVKSEGRPAVLRERTQQSLQEYLRFRHLVRNLYADELRPEPIALLIRDLPAVWEALAADLQGFRAWLSRVAQPESP
jgi:hypothetical protein